MLDFTEIMGRIRQSLHHQRGERIYDKDIAKALGVKASYFAVIKKRNKIPYRAILLFANREKISLNWIFFNKSLS